jgi:hypothetical protein
VATQRWNSTTRFRIVLKTTPSMKSLTEHLWFEVPNRGGFINITGTVEDLVKRSAVQEGLCLVNATSASIRSASLRVQAPSVFARDLEGFHPLRRIKECC